MPNRILRDWTDSLRVDKLTAPAECLFVRLIMSADDFARFHADPRLLKAKLYPLRSHSADEIEGWLRECVDAGLVRTYTYGGRAYLEVLNFKQSIRATESKFPPPPDDCSADAAQPRSACSADAAQPRPYAETKAKTETGNPFTPPASRKSTRSAVEVALPFPSEAFKAAWAKWRKHRQEKRKPLTPTCEEQQLKDLAVLDEAGAIAAITRSISAGWQGIFPKKANGSPQPSQLNDDAARRAHEAWLVSPERSRMLDNQ